MTGIMVIVRHGEAEGNIDITRCRNDDLNFLTHRGTLQAQLAGETLKNLGIPIHSVVCSPMLRARQTCSHIIQNADIDISIQILDSLRECRSEEQHSGTTTLEAANKIKQMRSNGNVLIVMHYFSMYSLVKHFDFDLQWQGCQNAVLNIISSENKIDFFDGNKEHSQSFGSGL